MSDVMLSSRAPGRRSIEAWRSLRGAVARMRAFGPTDLQTRLAAKAVRSQNNIVISQRPKAASCWMAATLSLVFCAADAQENKSDKSAKYPDRPIRIVVPFPPGGAVDMVARVVAQTASVSLGQQVIIENKGGAGGTIGAEAVAKAAPDGYTLLMGTASTHGTNSATMKQLSYDPVRDFAPVTMVATTPYVLVANPSVPVNSVGELISYARANPGRLNFSTFGSGSSNHLAAELFMALAGVNMVHVPYRGASPAMVDLVAGQVQIMFDTFPSSIPYLQSRKIKLLGVGDTERSPLFPSVPTLAEAGVKGYAAGTWFAIFAPHGTPREIVARLQREFAGAAAQPEVRQRFVAMGLSPASSESDELGKRVALEISTWQGLVRNRNLKFD